MKSQVRLLAAVRQTLLGAVLQIVLGITSCLAAGPSVPPVTVGLIVSTNPAAAAHLVQGALLGAEAASARFGVPVQLAWRDAPDQWGADGNLAAELAVDNNVAGLITPAAGAAAHQILQVAGRTRIPVISLCPDTSITRAGVPWARRIVAQTSDEAHTLFATLAAQRPAARIRCVALAPPGRAGREVSRDLGEAARTAGVEWVQVIEAIPYAMNTVIPSLLAPKPDAILLWVDAQLAAHAARELRTARFTGMLGLPSALNSLAFLQAAGKASDGCIIASVGPPGLLVTQFENVYRQRFGAAPDGPAVMVHHAVLVLAAEIQSGRVKEIEGASGLIKFDLSGNRLVALEVLRCKDGAFKPAAKWARATHPEMDTAQR